MSEKNEPWAEFVKKDSFTGLMVKKCFIEDIDDDAWANILQQDFEALGYPGTQQLLKPLMHHADYRKLITRFNNFRSKRKHKKTTVTLKSGSLEMLNVIKRRLGLSASNEEGIDAVIMYLADPREFDIRDRFRASDLVSIARDDLRLETRMELFLSNAPYETRMLLEQFMMVCLNEGWDACKNKRGRKTEGVKVDELDKLKAELVARYINL